MSVLSTAVRAAMSWGVALAVGLATSRIPSAGLLLGVLGLAYAFWQRALPPTLRLALPGSLLLATLLPWAALAGDPFHALPGSAAWPLATTSWAMLGSGSAAWAWLGRTGAATPNQAPPAVLAPLALRRLLMLELTALALLLPVSIAATQIALGLTAATLLLAYVRGARARLVTPLDLPVAALLAAASISTSLSSTPTSPLEVTALRTLLAFYVVARALGVASPSDRELGRLVGAWAGASAVVSALALAQHWTGFDAVAALGLRSPVSVPAPESPGHLAGIGTFASRLTFAHATLVPLAMLLGLQLAGSRSERPPSGGEGRVRRWVWAVLGLQVAGLWSTFARAAWFALATVAAAAIGVVVWTRERARALRWLAILGAGMALVLALSPGTRAWARAGVSPSDNHDRLFLWARAAQVALDHPVTGVGFGSYHLFLGPYYDRFDPAFPMRTWAHDMPLSLLCETGPLGLFAFVWLLLAGLGLGLSALRPSNRPSMRRGLALGGALATLAFAVVSTFHDTLYDGQVGYNVFFALGLAVWAVAEEDR
jgi:O-antigen ligase